MKTKMFNNLNMVLEVTGLTAFIGSVLLTIWNEIAEYIDLKAVSPYIVFVTSVVGLLFMISKWRGQILSNRKTRMEIEEKKKNRP